MILDTLLKSKEETVLLAALMTLLAVTVMYRLVKNVVMMEDDTLLGNGVLSEQR